MDVKSFIAKIMLTIIAITASTDKVLAKSQQQNDAHTTISFQQAKEDVPKILKKVRQVETDFSRGKPYSVQEKDIENALNKLEGVKMHLVMASEYEQDQEQKNLILLAVDKINTIIGLFHLVYEYDLDKEHIRKELNSNRDYNVYHTAKEIKDYLQDFQEKISRLMNNSIINENKVLMDAVKELAPTFIGGFLKDMHTVLSISYLIAKSKPTKTHLEVLFAIQMLCEDFSKIEFDSSVWSEAGITHKKMSKLVQNIKTFLESHGLDENYGVTTTTKTTI